jgi:lipopolysaccharide/colanic/teichoic acid biosynthesis glycosyltransferase
VTAPARELRLDSRLRRIVDVACSGVGLAAVSPLFALIAVATKLDSAGPVFYSQRRVGKGGVEFGILKFRTMVQNADRIGPAIAGRRDPRITRFGALLRATKLDELPQLVNVLRGEMTLIGSRAEVPELIRHYTDRERQILETRPGLTGPGQIYFTTDQAAELDGAEDGEDYYVTHQLHAKLQLDLAYLEDRSLRRDLVLLWRTVLVMLGLYSRPASR